MKGRLPKDDKSGTPEQQPLPPSTTRAVDTPQHEQPAIPSFNLNLTRDNILRLQHTIGNQGVLRLLARTSAQSPHMPPLKVNHPPSDVAQRVLMTKDTASERVMALDNMELDEKLDAIKDKLGDYHFDIGYYPIPAKPKKAGKGATKLLEKLDAVVEACDAYSSAYELLKQTRTKEESKEAKKEDEEEEEKLQETTDALAKEIKDQVVAEKLQIQKVVENAEVYKNLRWATALAFSDVASLEKNKLTGEPAELEKDSNKVTEHRLPELQQPRKSPPTPRGAATKYSDLKIIAGEHTPVRTKGGDKPAPTDLYDAIAAPILSVPSEVEKKSDMPPESKPSVLPTNTPQTGKKLPPLPPKKNLPATPLPQKVGSKLPEDTNYWFEYSIDKPLIQSKLVPDTLFIEGTPTGDDIRQGGIGDCYFLAAVSSIVEKDPGKLKQIIKASGGQVQAYLFRYNSGAGTWQLQMVEVNQALVRKKGDGGVDASGYKVAEVPVQSDWYVTLNDKKAIVHRVDHFEAGLWAPLLEKAYARFAQEYGQYGGQMIGKEEDKPKSTCGYGSIESGTARFVYNLFYGFEMEKQETAPVDYKPEESSDDNNVTRNREAIKRLLQLQGKGLGSEEQMHMTASSTRVAHIKRCLAALKMVESSIEVKNYLEKLELEDKVETIKAYEVALGEFKTQLDTRDKANDADRAKPEELQPVAEAAQKLTELSADWSALFHKPALERPKIVADFLELALDISTIGTDYSTGQRFVYSRHEYAVHQVVFKTESGDTIDNLKQALPVEDLGRISPLKSTVVLYNPHHANAPNLSGRGFSEMGKDGVFELSLDQFFRHFETLDIGIVRKPK